MTNSTRFRVPAFQRSVEAPGFATTVQLSALSWNSRDGKRERVFADLHGLPSMGALKAGNAQTDKGCIRNKAVRIQRPRVLCPCPRVCSRLSQQRPGVFVFCQRTTAGMRFSCAVPPEKLVLCEALWVEVKAMPPKPEQFRVSCLQWPPGPGWVAFRVRCRAVGDGIGA